MALYIVTDSASDLPDSIIKEFKLEVLPMALSVNGENYANGMDFEQKKLMDLMRKGAKVSTSQITMEQYINCFEKYAKNGDNVICIIFSSALSGTFNSANAAKQEILERYPDFDVTLIDSKCASLGFGMVVYYALLKQKSGATKEELIENINYNLDHMEHIFTVDDLEYLFRGGRVSRTKAIVGSILGIKPVLDVDDEGRLRPIEKARGRRASIKRMAEIAGERCDNLKDQILGITHGDDNEAVEELKGYLKKMYGCENFLVNDLGAIIGAHSGPGTLALFFIGK